MPLEAIGKMIDDPSARLEIKECGCHFVVDCKAKSMPKGISMEQTFKLDEQFDWPNPFNPSETLKVCFDVKD